MIETERKTAIAICVHNNAGTRRDIVERALRQGCTDCDVRELLAGLPVTLLRHEKDRGKELS